MVFGREELGLEEKMLESELAGAGHHRAILGRGNRPPDFGGSLKARPILAHQAYGKGGGKRRGKPLEDGDRVGHLARENQMTDDRPPPGDPVVVHVKVGLLDIHLLQGGPGMVEIIRRAGIHRGRFRQAVFAVRKIDVHDPGQMLDDGDMLIAVRVVDERETKPLIIGEKQSAEDGED